MIKSIHSKLLSYTFYLLMMLTLTVNTANATESIAGAVNNWFNVSNATYLSVDMKPTYGEDGYHYYSLSPFFEGKNYGLYSGIQTNGLINGRWVGNMFIFSVWNATVAYPENGATATPFDGEGVGYSLRKAYDWNVGNTYNVMLKRESFDSANNGYRWSATLKNVDNGSMLKLGEIVAPNGANYMRSGSLFHERFSGSTPSCGSSSSNLEKAGVTFSNLNSDRSISINTNPANNGIFASSACSPYIHTTSSSSKISTGFGMTNTEFINGPTVITPPTPAPAPTPNPTPTPTPTQSQNSTPAITPQQTNQSTRQGETIASTSTNNSIPVQDSKKPLVKTVTEDPEVLGDIFKQLQKELSIKPEDTTLIIISAVTTAIIVSLPSILMIRKRSLLKKEIQKLKYFQKI